MPLGPFSAGRIHSPKGLSGGPAPWKRRLVTILSAGLSGVKELSCEIDPGEVRQAVNVCTSYLKTAIVARGGTIQKCEGGRMIALFGCPASRGDYSERAIRAGFDMIDVLGSINRVLTLRLKVKARLGLRVGIQGRSVAAGEAGIPEMGELTVTGDAVNMASRLSDAAGRGEIVVSKQVFRASRHLFEYEALEPVAVEGIARSVQIFRPLREKAKPDPKSGMHGYTCPTDNSKRVLFETQTDQKKTDQTQTDQTQPATHQRKGRMT